MTRNTATARRLALAPRLLAGVSALAAGAALSLSGLAAVHAQEVETAPDDSYVSVSGEVVSAGANAFTLDYGEGLITVEMDDYDFDADAAPLGAGDDVTVYGLVDDDFYEARTIEASSVYNDDTNTFHYASAADEEMDVGLFAYPAMSYEGPGVTLTGTITSVDGREFVLDSAATEVEVDTAGLAYDPLDDEGVQQLDVGDRVSVSGALEQSLFDNTELSADGVLLLADRIED